MIVFKTKDYAQIENPNPGTRLRETILTKQQPRGNVGGILIILPPGDLGTYHFHDRRESIIIPISGQAMEIVEGKEIPLEVGDVMYIPAGEKHTAANRTNKEFRFLEFFTNPPLEVDFIEVK